MNDTINNSRRGRDELKAYFRKNSIPTEEHFAELIDSMPNYLDDEWLRSIEEQGVQPTQPNQPQEEETPRQKSDYFTIPADKEWHDTTATPFCNDYECAVYNVFVFYGDDDKVRLTQATAIWTKQSGCKIKSNRKHWWGWGGCACIRWSEDGCLQIRSRKETYGELRCRIVEMFNS